MSSTYLRRDGRWETRVSLGSVNGKRQSRSFYGATREQAERNMLSAFSLSVPLPVTEMSVRKLCFEWLNICQLRVKVSTLANYRMKIEKHIIPHFGDKMCCEVTSKNAYEFMQSKLKSGLSVRYVTDIMVLLKSIFRYAHREYGIISPFDTIIMPKERNDKYRKKVETGTPQGDSLRPKRMVRNRAQGCRVSYRHVEVHQAQITA